MSVTRLHVRMGGRSATEPHRASTPLELLFDLTFVVAVAALASELTRAVIAGDAAEGVVRYLMVFFVIWWAWMNFTWLASAFDVDDVPYRLFTIVQMAGVLVVAAGVPSAFERGDYAAITIGYLIMRAGLVAQWARAAIEQPGTRAAAVRYAVGGTLLQVGWFARLSLPSQWSTPSFVALVVLELAVPLWAERAASTSWHPGHIAERYGLFVIILLGESVAAATAAMKTALASHGVTPALVTVGAAGLVLVVSIWWLYFLEPSERGLRAHPTLSFFWGYGHWFLFAAIAAIGVGLAVAVNATVRLPVIGGMAVGYAIGIPLAAVFLLLFVLHLPLAQQPEVPGWIVVPAVGVALLIPLAEPAVGVSAVVVCFAWLGTTVVAAAVGFGGSRRAAGGIPE